jgi:hypothetical protein
MTAARASERSGRRFCCSPSFDRTIDPSRFDFNPPPASADDVVPR